MNDEKFDKIVRDNLKEEINIPNDLENIVKENMNKAYTKKVVHFNVFKRLGAIAAILATLTAGGFGYAKLTHNKIFDDIGMSKLGDYFEENSFEIGESISNENGKITLERISVENAFVIVEYTLELNDECNYENPFEDINEFSLNEEVKVCIPTEGYQGSTPGEKDKYLLKTMTINNDDLQGCWFYSNEDTETGKTYIYEVVDIRILQEKDLEIKCPIDQIFEYEKGFVNLADTSKIVTINMKLENNLNDVDGLEKVYENEDENVSVSVGNAACGKFKTSMEIVYTEKVRLGDALEDKGYTVDVNCEGVTSQSIGIINVKLIFDDGTEKDLGNPKYFDESTELYFQENKDKEVTIEFTQLLTIDESLIEEIEEIDEIEESNEEKVKAEKIEEPNEEVNEDQDEIIDEDQDEVIDEDQEEVIDEDQDEVIDEDQDEVINEDQDEVIDEDQDEEVDEDQDDEIEGEINEEVYYQDEEIEEKLYEQDEINTEKITEESNEQVQELVLEAMTRVLNGEDQVEVEENYNQILALRINVKIYKNELVGEYQEGKSTLIDEFYVVQIPVIKSNVKVNSINYSINK